MKKKYKSGSIFPLISGADPLHNAISILNILHDMNVRAVADRNTRQYQEPAAPIIEDADFEIVQPKQLPNHG